MKPSENPRRSNQAVETLAGAAVAASADERPLVERARGRDPAAFRVLVERHRDRAYGLALRILRSPADAEEIAQDAFVRAWLALPQFRGESSFSTWLYRIVARRAFDRSETLRHRRAREADLEAAENVAWGADASLADGAWWGLRLERLIAGLSETQRAVVTLFYYEGHSVAQVSATLGMPTGTIKTHLSRARAALRRGWLKPEGQAP